LLLFTDGMSIAHEMTDRPTQPVRGFQLLSVSTITVLRVFA
jgi:hypothetical protein